MVQARNGHVITGLSSQGHGEVKDMAQVPLMRKVGNATYRLGYTGTKKVVEDAVKKYVKGTFYYKVVKVGDQWACYIGPLRKGASVK